jgi:transcriptional regulator with XRE-family HTH domain
MKERILEFLRAENKSSAQFAEEIGVQPSGISHILSGRNNPSLDFVLKMLEKYRFISSEWLLFGKGTMYRDSKMQTLFEELDLAGKGTTHAGTDLSVDMSPVPERMDGKQDIIGTVSRKDADSKAEISRIVMFYSDGTYEEYTKR